MQNVPAQQPLITPHLWLTFGAVFLGLDRQRQRLLTSASFSPKTRWASGGPGAPVTAEQAKKHSLEKKSRLMKLCLLGFFKKHEDREVLTKKRISWNSVVLAFSFHEH